MIHNPQIHQHFVEETRKSFLESKRYPYLWHARPQTHPSCKALSKKSWQVLICPAFCCKPQGDGKAENASCCKCLDQLTQKPEGPNFHILVALGSATTHLRDPPESPGSGSHFSKSSRPVLSSHLSESMRRKAGIVGLPSQSCNHA